MSAVLAFGVSAARTDEFFGAPGGILYNDTTVPYSKYFDGNVKPLKKGEATCKNYFFLVAKGQCGINDVKGKSAVLQEGTTIECTFLPLP